MFFTYGAQLGYNTINNETPNDLSNTNRISISNGYFDTVHISNNQGMFSDLGWTTGTIFYAKFENSSIDAGPLDVSSYNGKLNNIILVIRRRNTDALDAHWLPIIYDSSFYLPTDNSKIYTDRYAANNKEYEYQMLLYDKTDDKEIFRINANITTSFNGIFITDVAHTFKSILEMNYDIDLNHDFKSIRTIDNKYPYVINHSKSIYYSGSVSGTFIPFDEITCKLDFNSGTKYRDMFMEFLVNGRAKILKTYDGRIWMISIADNSPSESQDNFVEKYTTTFDWVEIGDINNINDYVDNGLINETLLRYAD